MNHWIALESGLRFTYGKDDEVLHPSDLIYNIVFTRRFGGALSKPWSVGKHSWGVMSTTAHLHPSRTKLQLSALAHDFHEGPFGDMPTPAQKWIEEEHPGVIENAKYKLDMKIEKALGIEIVPRIKWEYDELKAIDRLWFALEYMNRMDNKIPETINLCDSIISKFPYQSIKDAEHTMRWLDPKDDQEMIDLLVGKYFALKRQISEELKVPA